MATGKTAGFEDLIKLATDFVTMRKGSWDHADWQDFISKVQAQGFDTSEDTQMNLGKMIEATRQFYMAAVSVESLGNAVETVVKDSVTFVKRHKGIWGHPEWEDFVKTVERNTFTLSEGTMSYLGGILESIRTLYTASPAATETETATTPGTLPETPNRRDDLTAINGIGPVFAKKLNGEGIFSYARIAALSDDDIERLENKFTRLSGRIKRDDWIGQAKALAAGR